jgi:hypothetical protein
MKKVLADVMALVGGIWTGLCGTLLMGLLLSLAQDPEFYAPQAACVALLTGIGVLLLWAGLRSMKSGSPARS